MGKVTQLSDNVYIAEFDPVANDAALITFTNPREHSNKIRNYFENADGKRLRTWGDQNDLPQYREWLVGENNIVGSLVATKRDITLGAGLYTYKEHWDSDKKQWVREPVDMPQEAQDFFEASDIDKQLMCAARNLFLHANVFTEFIRNKKGDKIALISTKQCKHIRAEEQNDRGVIDNYFWSGRWIIEDGQTNKDYKIITIPAYKKDTKQTKFLLHTGDDLLGDDYYFEPAWWGGSEWIEVANTIPEFHKANMKHGYTLRYHIEIPKGYFYSRPSAETEDAKKEAIDQEAKKRHDFIDSVNKFLAGVKNAGRALFTEYELNKQLGKDFPGIKITTINTDMKDEALLKLFEKSNEANISAQGIHPTLANIQTQGKLSSGSEMRLALQTYLVIKSPLPRKILLQPINLVKKINGWPADIKFGFRDVEITRLDQEKSGTREANVTQGS